ncbi:MAG: 23S rRNA (pseudouridine(1915)-N(3))-methyltransferase RlmH, partial [Candidatus Delongbacteria bacterium]|nr:23S rRNA (pseudouridine(1915)-N(3))-methyltransferase RlmH [Candidatus Delongbacteria bacterium]MCG2760330.1 23S rRNA (pseudouridine(1915)-N(3))-methyltransferase RlmH [Candidatus Delongbacteria bacterium]
SEEVKKYADLRLSFSDMTMTHQMIRLFLSEQIYRAYSIINNKKYHK